MGCWGITAFESDDGLDALGDIRYMLPMDGNARLADILDAIKEDKYLPKASDGQSHTAPMALAEVVVKFVNQDIGDLDYDEEWAAGDNKFYDVHSFTATKEPVQWIRDYLAETLKARRESAAYWAETGEDSRPNWRSEWGGWKEEEDWIGWQNHMEMLVGQMDTLLAKSEDQIELVRPQEQTNGPVLGQSI